VAGTVAPPDPLLFFRAPAEASKHPRDHDFPYLNHFHQMGNLADHSPDGGRVFELLRPVIRVSPSLGASGLVSGW